MWTTRNRVFFLFGLDGNGTLSPDLMSIEAIGDDVTKFETQLVVHGITPTLDPIHWLMGEPGNFPPDWRLFLFGGLRCAGDSGGCVPVRIVKEFVRIPLGDTGLVSTPDLLSAPPASSLANGVGFVTLSAEGGLPIYELLACKSCS